MRDLTNARILYLMVVAVAAVSVLLAGCGSSTSASPTLAPKATAVVTTATLQPTATARPTQTPTPTSTPRPATATPKPATATPTATATPRAAAGTTGSTSSPLPQSLPTPTLKGGVQSDTPAGNWVTSSFRTANNYYAASDPRWKQLSPEYRIWFDTAEELLAAYPDRQPAP